MASDQLLQECRSILAPELGHGFDFDEIIKPGNRRFEVPPTARLCRRLVLPLRFGNALRTVMIEKHGAKGLLVHAAYRPKGGASNSMHKHARALDLDLYDQDVERLGAVYYEEAVTLAVEWGVELYIGIGLYCPLDACRGRRIHIDVGGYDHNRHWQHGYKAGRSDVLVICERLGLKWNGKHVDDESDDDDDEPTKKVSPPTAAGPSL